MKYWAFHCNPNAWDSVKEISEHVNKYLNLIFKNQRSNIDI